MSAEGRSSISSVSSFNSFSSTFSTKSANISIKRNSSSGSKAASFFPSFPPWSLSSASSSAACSRPSTPQPPQPPQWTYCQDEEDRARRRELAQYISDEELIALCQRHGFQSVVNILSGSRTKEAPPSYEEAIKHPPFFA